MITKGRDKGDRKYEHLDDAPLPIIVCHGERMTIEYANQKALSLFDSSKHRLVRNTISEILPDAFPEEIIRQIYHDCFIKGQTTCSKSRRFIQYGKENIKVLWFTITSQPIRDEDLFGQQVNQMLAPHLSLYCRLPEVSGRSLVVNIVDKLV